MGNEYLIIEKRLSFGHLVAKLKKKMFLYQGRSDENRRIVFVLFCAILLFFSMNLEKREKVLQNYADFIFSTFPKSSTIIFIVEKPF